MAAWTAKIKGNNLSGKTIYSIFQLQRSFIYCKCKTKYEGQAGFFVVCFGAFTFKPPFRSDDTSPLKRIKKDAGEEQNECPNCWATDCPGHPTPPT